MINSSSYIKKGIEIVCRSVSSKINLDVYAWVVRGVWRGRVEVVFYSLSFVYR